MRIAVASSGDSPQAQMDPRFGRCPYVVVVETDTMDYQAIENPGPQMGSGAGISAAQLVADAGAQAVVAGNYGPKATQTLQAAGIRLFQGAGMMVAQAAQAAAAGQLPEVSGATVADKAGLGGGAGMGGGGGMGRGGGGGRGMGGGQGMGPGGGMGQGMGPGGGMGPWGAQPGMMGPMGPQPGMMGGPMGPQFGYPGMPSEEEMREYHLSMLRAQADMIEQQLEFIRAQIQYLEGGED